MEERILTMQKRVLGLTGPTGAGKSVAAAVFAREGCTVIDCDRIARDVTRTDAACLQALAAAFGSGILLPDGTLDRRKLASVAFASHENELKLNAITHPPIMERVRAEIRAARTEAVVLDAPLLFESGADALCGQTAAVLAAEQTRCRRIMARDGITEEEALRRISAQQPDDFYRRRADVVFENDAGPAAFEEAVRRWIRRFLHKQPF